MIVFVLSIANVMMYQITQSIQVRLRRKAPYGPSGRGKRRDKGRVELGL